MKKILFLILLNSVVLSIYSNGNKESDISVETKEITFAFNGEDREVIIPVNPKRVVVIGYDTLDIIDSLGYKDRVIGVVDPKGPLFPKYLTGYENVQSAGSLWGDDFETIAGLKPDLIIASARTSKNFEALNEIAPAVYFTIPGMGSPFKDKLFENIDTLSNIFSTNSEELKKEIDNKIMSVKEITSKIEDPTALFLIVTGKTIGLYSDDAKSRYGFVFNELGFTSPASLEEIQKDSAQHGNSISYEFISSKNPNYLLIIDRGAGTGEDDISAKDTLNNQIVAQTTAFKNDNLIYLDPTSWYISTGGVQSTLNMLDNLLTQVK